MNLLYLLSGLITVALFVYLLIVLFYPDLF